MSRGLVYLVMCSIALTVLCVLFSSEARAADIEVTNGGDSGEGSLRAAISQADANGEADTIRFAEGVETVTLTSGELIVRSEIEVEGGGATVERSDASGTPEFRIFNVQNTGNMTLRDLTVRNGAGGGDNGGGILNEGTLKVEGSTFSDNFASSGGGIANFRGTLTVEDSTFTENSATSGSGGGISNTGTLTVEGSAFFGNSAANRGGGIANDEGTLTVEGSTFSNNSAFNGGGINNRGTLTVESSTFSENAATSGSGGSGGGIYTNTERLTSEDPPTERTTITNSTFWENSARLSGSGVLNFNGYTEINYSTVSQNSSTSTGANGFGVANSGNAGTVTRLTATIVTGNTTGTAGSTQSRDVGNTDNNGSPYLSGGFNVLGTVQEARQDDFDGSGDVTGVTVEDAFGTDSPTLSDNGGPTETVATVLGALAINRVATDAEGVPDTDQRGVERPQYNRSDSGAFEYDDEPPTITISPETLPEATEDEAYSQQLTASGEESSSPYTFTITEGELPDGLTLSDEGLISGTPTEAAQTENFTVTATDASGFSDTRNYTLTVQEVNDAPVARDDSFTTDEDVALETSVSELLANDDDGDGGERGENLTLTDLSNPQNGEIIVEGDSITFIPDSDFNGDASFDYEIEDSEGLTDTATVTVTVNAVNDNPVARDDEYATVEDDPLLISTARLLTNDDDGDGGPRGGENLRVTRVFDAVRGTVSLSEDGSRVTFTPERNYNGDEASFRYEITDGQGNESVATAKVTIGIAPVNDIPVTRDDYYETAEDTLLDETRSILSNDSDEDGDTLTATLERDVQNGTLVLRADGSFTYTPDDGFNGDDTFIYTASDPNGGTSEPATVTIEVGPQNDAPVISDVQDRTIRENSSTGPLRFRVTDPDDKASSLRVSVASSNTALVKASGIKLSGSGENRTITVTPVKNRSGSTHITLTVTDPDGLKATDTFVLTVKPAQIPPEPPSNRCTIKGTPGSDVLRGTPGRDVICGLGGNDRLIGLGGDDILRGGDGNDLLEGGSGDDELYGEGGNDRLVGGAGEDKLNGGPGQNKLSQ